MAILAQLLNGTNLCRDSAFQAEKSVILKEGVQKNYSGELAVTTNQVAAGRCFIRITRDAVTPNEIFIIPIWVTSNVVVDTSGNGWIIVRVDRTKVNNGSTNALDGSGIAYVEKVTSLPVSDPYIILATLSAGVITDVRPWVRISHDVWEDAIYYAKDVAVTDSYQVTISGVKRYIDGQEYTFKANTTNIGAATFQINALPAKSIRKNFNVPLNDGDINGGQIVVLRYDADNDFMQMVSATATTVSAASLNQYTLGTIGEVVSASDITNNRNLMYQNKSDRKWYKVTTDPTTYSGKRLAILTESANTNDANKKLLIKGIYQNLTVPATVAPSFSANGTGSGNPVGTSVPGTDVILEYIQIDNTNGAEFEVPSVVISADQVGTPSGPLFVYACLQSYDTQEQFGKPAIYWDNTNYKARGAIIGETSIPQINFSGVFQDLTATFSSPIKIPAGAIVSICVSKGGVPNGSNYYRLQGNGFNFRYYNFSTNSWTGAATSTPKYTLNVNSVSTTGYGIKAYTGLNGSYGLTPENPWSKVIGEVLSTTEFFFDPERSLEQGDYASYVLDPTANAASGFRRIQNGFCASKVFVTLTAFYQAALATNNRYYSRKGMLRADKTDDGNGKVKFSVGGNGLNVGSLDNFLGGSNNTQSLKGIRLGQNNTIHLTRLENGFYVYNSYPTGSSFISEGVTGYINTTTAFEFISSV